VGGWVVAGWDVTMLYIAHVSDDTNNIFIPPPPRSRTQIFSNVYIAHEKSADHYPRQRDKNRTHGVHVFNEFAVRLDPFRNTTRLARDKRRFQENDIVIYNYIIRAINTCLSNIVAEYQHMPPTH
jgi:hypothetical protein